MLVVTHQCHRFVLRAAVAGPQLQLPHVTHKFCCISHCAVIPQLLQQQVAVQQ